MTQSSSGQCFLSQDERWGGAWQSQDMVGRGAGVLTMDCARRPLVLFLFGGVMLAVVWEVPPTGGAFVVLVGGMGVGIGIGICVGGAG